MGQASEEGTCKLGYRMIYIYQHRQGGYYGSVTHTEFVEVPSEFDDLREEIMAWLCETRHIGHPDDVEKHPALFAYSFEWAMAPDYDIQYRTRVADFFLGIAESEAIPSTYRFPCVFDKEKTYYFVPNETFWNRLPQRVWAHLLAMYERDDTHQPKNSKNRLIPIFKQEGERRWPPLPPEPKIEPVIGALRFEREALL